MDGELGENESFCGPLDKLVFCEHRGLDLIVLEAPSSPMFVCHGHMQSLEDTIWVLPNSLPCLYY